MMRVSGTPVRIAGVLPARAVWPEDADVFLPLRPALLNDDVRTRRDNMIFDAVARLADGVSIGSAAPDYLTVGTYPVKHALSIAHEAATAGYRIQFRSGTK